MSRLEIILSAILFFSILLNIGLIMYVRGAIVRLLSVSEELGDLQEMINAFTHHLKIVYELDTFYGDETLQGLLHHAASFNEQLETFEYIYSLTQDPTSEGDPAIDDDTTEETQEENS
ncbi:hypothetical protein CMI47_10330 [Candidatus Pacearchaeota archaeon]|nr:hypothetical protein [Candidatus Pacearchaeota archaeon]|tara:strand:+ start:153 stop:506 length:354 start_codon:yes stop_codon:yes gene_type:complete